MSPYLGSFLLNHGMAAGSVALATWFRLLLDPVLGIQFPFATMPFAIVLAAWYGGFGPALAATVLGAISGTWVVMPRGGFAVPEGDQQISLVLYCSTSVGIALLGGAMHAARLKIRAANDQFDARVEERTAELARANQALQTSEERFRLLMEGVQEYAIFMLDPAGIIVTWNAGAERSKGYRADEIIGRHFSCFYPAEDLARGKPEQELELARSEGRCEDEGWRVRKDGSRFWARVVITALHDSAGRPRGFAKVTRDITAGMWVRTRFAQVVESALNAMVMINPEGEIVLVNTQTEKLFGYGRDELIGQPVELLVPERFRGKHPSFRNEFFAKPLARPMGMGRDLYGRRKDGSEFPVEIGLNPIKTDEGLVVVSAIVDITERKRMEEAMRDSEERFRMMANSIPQLAWIAHADGQIFWYNRRWYEFTGTSAEPMGGWGWQSEHGPQVLPRATERWKNAIDAGMPFEMVFPLRGADGKFRAFLTRVEPWKDSEGRVVQWFGTNTDVEELTRLEESLRASQARLQSTLAAGSIGTWTWNIASDCLIADEFTARMFAVEPQSAAHGLPAKAYLQAVLPEDQPRVADALARAIQSRGLYDVVYQVQPQAGEYRWLQAKGRVEGSPADHTLHFHGAVMDITERKRAEQELRESEQRLRLFIDYAPAALAMFDQAMCYLAASHRWKGDYGLPDGDIAGRSHYDLFPDLPASWKLVHQRALTGEVVRVDEDHFVRADGLGQWLRWEARPWYRADHSIGGIVIFTEDITDRKNAKDALQQANAELEHGLRQLAEANRELKAKTQENEAFVYSVSHDLRSPLVNLQGFSKELNRAVGELRSHWIQSAAPVPDKDRILGILDGPMAKATHFIQSAVMRLSNIIDALLRLSRAGRVLYNLQRVDVGAVVQRVVDSLRGTKDERGASIQIDPLPAALGDPAAVEQIFANLIGNALHYLDGDRPGRIEISGAGVQSEGGPTELQIYRVRDNGLGIADASRAKIFQPFQRLYPQAAPGEGMGLAIVLRVVERHGGKIWFESTAGLGTSFFVALPACSDAELPAGLAVAESGLEPRISPL